MLEKTSTIVNIIISQSISKRQEAKNQRKFQEITTHSLEDIATTITQKPWSPIIWNEGERKSTNFKQASIYALDFDHGLTIEHAHKLFTKLQLSHIIATTKSHRKEKTSPSGAKQPPCDRFRVILIPEQTITEKDTYTHNIMNLANIFSSDPSCKDTARFFFPSINITHIHHAKKLPVLKPENSTSDIITRYEKSIERHQKNKTLPAWIIGALEHGALIGERHLTCYKLGATMHRLGYSEDFIITCVKKSPLKDIGENDIIRAIRNGIQRSENERRR